MPHIIPEGSLHHEDEYIVEKIQGLFHIIPFSLLRKTPNVDFHALPFMERCTGMDRVIHAKGAKSPGPIGETSSPWYMHPNQEDNLFTMSGNRVVELYHPDHGKIERFEVSSEHITWNGKVVLDEPGYLGWPVGVFHRNHSPEGSSSLNMAIRFPNFNIDYEFNIYDINENTQKYTVIREGHLDQKFS